MNFINEVSWLSILGGEFQKPYFKELAIKIDGEKNKGKIILPFPYHNMVYRALEMCPFDKVKVVILGQDPYPNLRDANGLAFSVSNTSDVPKTLLNIFRELKSDTRIDNISKAYGDLSYWAVQGVLLLNTILTCNEGESNSHKGFGWETFTDKILMELSKKKNVVYLLMGKDAQSKKKLIQSGSKTSIVIETAHPSPNSAHKGFFFSKPFSRINASLIKNETQPINWSL